MIKFNELPLNALSFVSESGLIGGGHGFSPLAFASAGDTWALVGALEAKDEKAVAKKEEASSGAASARAMFEKMNSSSKVATVVVVVVT